MSRLESNAEPSMEEILASIRKIIAEEPPGSRGRCRPYHLRRTTPAPSPQRGFMSREAFMRSDASAGTRGREPHFSSRKRRRRHLQPGRQPDAGHDNDRSSEALPSLSEGLDALAAGDAASSSSAIIPLASSKLERAADAGGSGEPGAASIDDQLVGSSQRRHRTGDGSRVTHGGADRASPSVTPAEEAQPEAPRDAIDRQPDTEPRPGFCVSRSGGADRSAESRESSDPFAFISDHRHSGLGLRPRRRLRLETRADLRRVCRPGDGEPEPSFGRHRSTLNG